MLRGPCSWYGMAAALPAGSQTTGIQTLPGTVKLLAEMSSWGLCGMLLTGQVAPWQAERHVMLTQNQCQLARLARLEPLSSRFFCLASAGTELQSCAEQAPC